jgi:hypothetical protein
MPETSAAGASKHQLSPSAEAAAVPKKPRGRGKGKAIATKAQATPGATDAESNKLPSDVELVNALPEDIVETLKGSKVRTINNGAYLIILAKANWYRRRPPNGAPSCAT